MRGDTWSDRSKEAIREAVLNFCDIYGLSPFDCKNLPPAQKAKVLKMISQWYPFGVRKRFPYKAWLKEVRIFREWIENVQKPLDGLFAVGDD